MRLVVHFAVKHPKIHRVDGDIFTFTFAPDCMAHSCRNQGQDARQRNDFCCQYGADVLIPEKAAILRRRAEIASVLRPERQNPDGWFDERDPERDPDAPGGILLRTATSDLENETSGCVFLEHTGERGCGLHRTALEHGFDPAEIKPMVCRLYPLSFTKRRLGISPDFPDYSCANYTGPTLYQLARSSVLEIFGAELIEELDRLESKVARRRLSVLGRSPSVHERAPE